MHQRNNPGPLVPALLARVIAVLCLLPLLAAVPCLLAQPTTNYALQLDGDASYVELPSHSFDQLKAATVEVWAKWEAFTGQGRVFDFGERGTEMYLTYDSRLLRSIKFLITAPGGVRHRLEVPGALQANQWFHLAVVTGQGGVRLYLNGMLIATNAYTGSFASLRGAHNYLGKQSWETTRLTFRGQMDEFRVWSVERTVEQIRQTMFQRLIGTEPGLFGLWNFDNPAQPARDATSAGRHGMMFKAQVASAALPRPEQLPLPVVFHGEVTSEDGAAISEAPVSVEAGGMELIGTSTDLEGRYQLAFYPTNAAGDLVAQKGKMGSRLAELPLRAGERQRLDLTLRDAISLSGKVTALDGSPLGGVLLEAQAADAETESGTDLGPLSRSSDAEGNPPRPRVVQRAMADEKGQFQFVNLGRGRYVVAAHGREGLVAFEEGKPLSFDGETPVEHVDFRLAPFKKGTWKTYTVQHNLPANLVSDIRPDRDGWLWFATQRGVAKFDGQTLTSLTEEDGLRADEVFCLLPDSTGVLWIGTANGLIRREGTNWQHFTTAQGLPHPHVHSLARDSTGVLWLGTDVGAARYDGRKFERVALGPGGISGVVLVIEVAADGHVWFGSGTGLWRFDPAAPATSGQQVIHYSRTNGLAGNNVSVIQHDPNGVLWVGTASGLSRFDGQKWETLFNGIAVQAFHRDADGTWWLGTPEGAARYDGRAAIFFSKADGLAGKSVQAIYRDDSGLLWFGTDEGLSSYDEQTMTSFTERDGLFDDDLTVVHAAPDGTVWFGYGGREGGLGRFDGRAFARFTRQDGLAGHRITALHTDARGVLWVGSYGDGVAGYNEFGRIGGGVATNGAGRFFVAGGVPEFGDGGVSSIRAAPDGALWFGNRVGFSKFDGQLFRIWARRASV